MIANMSDSFTMLFSGVRADLLGYLMSLGLSRADAEDVVQNAASIMHAKFDQFEQGTNFRAWAFTIARLQAKNAMRSRARRPLSLSPEVVEEIHTLAEQGPEAPRVDYLRRCIEKLATTARSLVRLRYQEELSMDEIAERTDRPVRSIITTFHRIRKTLKACVENLETEERERS
jgi:RNA polymerase sigma-70 factor (ECF subfamily)